MAYLSYQIQYATQETWDYLMETRPQWLLWLDWSPSGIQQLREYKHCEPNCWVIGRVVEQRDWTWDDEWNATLALFPLLRDVVYAWQLGNEPAESFDDVKRLNTWTLAKMDAAPAGFRGVIGNFAEGNPSGTSDQDPAGIVAWREFEKSMEKAVDRGWLLGIHEYDAETMRQTYPWRCGRYAKLVWPYLSAKAKRLPVIVGECGIDRGVSHIDKRQSGWLDTSPPTSESQYLEQLVWYKRLCEERPGPEMRALFVFLAGAHPEWGWTRFEILGQQQIGSFIRAQNSAAPIPPGGSMPEYIVGPGYQKVEHLIGPWRCNEIWYEPNTPHETSFAIGARGQATWRRKTNETVAICDNGEKWSDLGNDQANAGRLVKIYPK